MPTLIVEFSKYDPLDVFNVLSVSFGRFLLGFFTSKVKLDGPRASLQIHPSWLLPPLSNKNISLRSMRINYNSAFDSIALMHP